MKIGFNSDLFLRRPMTGIANYCFEMIQAQRELDGTIDYLGYNGLGWKAVDTAYLAGIAHDHHKNTSAKTETSALRKLWGAGFQLLARNTSRSPALRNAYRAVRRRRFSASLERIEKQLDLFHAFNFQPHADLSIPTLPVIYDLSFIRYPEAHPKDRLQSLKTLSQTIARAPLVQSISQFSKKEIMEVYGYPEHRIFVAPPAAASIFRLLGREVTQDGLAAFDLRYGSYFLAVGTLEPRKNIQTLIRAYQKLSSEERGRFPLVIVGGEGWGQLDLPLGTDRLTRDGSLRFVGAVSSTALRSLYEGTAMLLFPSIYEGFGMPVVEALACGAAVAHSANTSMDEITGDLAIRVPATDVAAWADVMVETIHTDTRNEPLLRLRINQANAFSWRQSASSVLKAYRKITASN